MLWYVALGSAVGGVCRVLLTTALQGRDASAFPLGTLAVNVAGSLLIGVVLRLAMGTPALSPELRALLAAGFCGGFTTFSTFSAETVALLEAGAWRRAGIYAGASVLLSLAAVIAGYAVARELLALRRP